MIGGAGVRGCEAADYLCKASTCKGQELEEGAKAPLAPSPTPLLPPLSSIKVTVPMNIINSHGAGGREIKLPFPCIALGLM